MSKTTTIIDEDWRFHIMPALGLHLAIVVAEQYSHKGLLQGS